MIGRVEKFFRNAFRLISRSEWSVRFLNLPKSSEITAAPGIVMIQVDGLSKTQMERAIKNGRMPFLSQLLKKEHYKVHTLYSGMPSSTPAFQAELFYGVKGAVPAFSFLDRKKNHIFRMFDPEAVEVVEKSLITKGDPLLKGGTIYSSIFSGGAAESHFCASSFGWSEFLKTADPLALPILFIFNVYSFLRLSVLLVLEFLIAVWDFITGGFERRNFYKELKFVPTRVGICVLLRELLVIGAKMDITRGLPIIYLNFLGYDEQAHRRGPSSLFAHWALKGIDDSIARVWRAAKKSPRRDYEVWIFSDHGQEEVTAYSKLGKSIETEVTEILNKFTEKNISIKTREFRGIQFKRAQYIRGKNSQIFFTNHNGKNKSLPDKDVEVTAMGPLGFVYLNFELSDNERLLLANELIKSTNVPLLIDTHGIKLRALTQEGEFFLPNDADKIVGKNHPFLKDVTHDLIKLCRHADCGDYILSGWNPGGKSISFPIENGAHAGPGTEETLAFALLPSDCHIQGETHEYIRALDIRKAVFQSLNSSDSNISRSVSSKNRIRNNSVRVMTYNCHSCIGMDGKLSPRRIARVIAKQAPDIIALQELDSGRHRTQMVDQANLIAKYLQMDFHFHPILRVEEELYGDAVLTSLPMKLIKAGRLPGLNKKNFSESRGGLWVEIKLNGINLQIINTHLSLWPREQKMQAKALVGNEWLYHPDCEKPVILLGDFNAPPSSSPCIKILEHLNDAQIELDNHYPIKTFFGRFPVARIDHIFIDSSLDVISIDVPSSALERVASDHLPLVAELRFS